MTLDAFLDVQIPLLAAMLLGACVAKVAQVLKSRGISNAFGPTALFPVSMRRPAAIGICVIEFSLGVGLILTSAKIGGLVPGMVVRMATGVFFVIATCALVELRASRPEAGCGCFGELSTAPVSLRTMARSALLAVAAFITVRSGQIKIQIPPPHHSLQALAAPIGILLAELLVIGALSPEIGEGLIRLGYSEPCELQIVPSGRTLAALHRSRQWRRHSRLITSAAPADIWRELCWRYVVYPASYQGQRADLVFAVFLKYRRPVIRAALVDSATGQPLPRAEAPARNRLLRRFARVPVARPAAGIAGSLATAAMADLPISTDV